MQVGFIGLGHMGRGMAANLLAGGHALTVYNRSSDKTTPLIGKGARLAKTPGDAARGQVVITMLAEDHAVERVVFDKGGILDSLAPGAIHVSMSTISVALAERLAAAHRERGQEFVAAPVFGRPDAAAAAKLFIVTAGKPQAVATCQPLFDALGLSREALDVTRFFVSCARLGSCALIAAAMAFYHLGDLCAHLGRLAGEVRTRAALGFRGVAGQLHPVNGKHLPPDQTLLIAHREHLGEHIGDGLA